MALDIWLISETGKGVKSAPLHLGTYADMRDWTQRNPQAFPLLSRLRAYYGAEGDAEFLPAETTNLLAELCAFAAQPGLPAASQRETEHLVQLVREAQRTGLGLEVRPD